MSTLQCTDTILMVRPANFGFNVETAENNAFQQLDSELSDDEIIEKAKSEFDHMVNILRDHGVNVIVYQDSEEPIKTDAVFPNNWISTHENGDLILYPMFSPNRRKERSEKLIADLSALYKLSVDKHLLSYESEDQFLEGTGSMIFDRPNKIIYACFSARTNKELLDRFGRHIGYEVIGFDASDKDDIPYYHTNVIMALGEHISIICTESIEDEAQKAAILLSLKKSGKIYIEITREQVEAFAGNMLEVKGHDSKNLMVMSTSAYKSLKEEELNIIKIYNKIVHLPLGTIEKIGGGSARCMIAEIFLPKRDIGVNTI